MRILKSILLLACILMVIYMLGPAVEEPYLDPQLDDLNISVEEVDGYVHGREQSVQALKPDNEARITWAGEKGKRTPYSIIYLHGFSASPAEGRPVHQATAMRYGANLYEARLYGHGIEEKQAFIDATGEQLLESAKEALAIGELIGDSVIIMSCSSGSTLALYLAAHHPEVHSLLVYSPNIEFAKPGSSMLTKPWGLQLARLMMRGKYRSFEDPSEEMQQYWTCKYRLEGLVHLKKLVETTMTANTFRHIHQPLFMGYYYKNETEQDDIVQVSEMLAMFGEVATPDKKKRKHAFPDAANHVILSGITSHDVEGVLIETFNFCEEVLGLKPVENIGLD